MEKPNENLEITLKEECAELCSLYENFFGIEKEENPEDKPGYVGEALTKEQTYREISPTARKIWKYLENYESNEDTDYYRILKDIQKNIENTDESLIINNIYALVKEWSKWHTTNFDNEWKNDEETIFEICKNLIKWYIYKCNEQIDQQSQKTSKKIIHTL